VFAMGLGGSGAEPVEEFLLVSCAADFRVGLAIDERVWQSLPATIAFRWRAAS